jgi:hypothetical protein
MKRLFSFAVLIGIVAVVVQYLNGDTAAGEWHDASDTASGL